MSSTTMQQSGALLLWLADTRACNMLHCCSYRHERGNHVTPDRLHALSSSTRVRLLSPQIPPPRSLPEREYSRRAYCRGACLVVEHKAISCPHEH